MVAQSMKLGGTNDFCSDPGVEDRRRKPARCLYRSFLLNVGGRVFGISHLMRRFLRCVQVVV